MKIVLPEKLSCIAIDQQGVLCVGGTATGKIYIWEVGLYFSLLHLRTHDIQTASGILYNAWDAHYRQVNVLRFTNDGSALVSGSDDSAVNVWSVSRSIRPSHS